MPSTIVIEEPTVQTVEVGMSGPQGPSGIGIMTGTEAERPSTPPEGTIYFATDTDVLYVYFT